MSKSIEEINEEIEEELFQDYLNEFRKEYIPPRYNQIELLNNLSNPNIDHFISISNRTDGKSFNYIHALIKIAIDYDIGLTFLSRNMMLRTSYQTLIDEIIEFFGYNRREFNFIRSQYYTTLTYKDQDIAVISDLNNAGELKYFSNYLKKFPIIVYDEFLALDTDYLSDEWERLQTIYESIDRMESYPLIHKPKIFYFGNAMNFNSPILQGLDIFNILEKHPINTAKVYHYDFHVMLEMNRNENANEQRNTRAFSSGKSSMSTGQFKTNSYLIANDDDKHHVRKNPREFYVKLKDDYLRVWFNADTYKIILSITTHLKPNDDYIFNMDLKDNKITSEYLKESYYDDKEVKKMDKGYYLFENNYSKNYIMSDFIGLNEIKIMKLIREFLAKDDLTELEHHEKQLKNNYIEDTKRYLMEKLGM